MNSSPVFIATPSIGLMIILALVVFGLVAAIRHGYGKVVLIAGAVGLVGLFVVGSTNIAHHSQSAPTQSAPTKDYHAASVTMPVVPPTHLQPQTQPVMLVPFLFVVSMIVVPLGLGFMIKYGVRQGNRILLGMIAGTAALFLIGGFYMATFKSVQTTHAVDEAHDSATRSSSFPQGFPTPASSPPPTVAGPVAQGIEHLVGSGATATPPAVTAAGLAPGLIRYTAGNAPSIPIQELPGWRKNPPHEGSLGAGRAKYVLTSQQFATVEEAEAELFRSLAADVQESFAKYHSPALGWTPTPEDLRLSGIIAERVVETFSVKVGEFENPVHRVSWLVEFDHDKSTVLLKRWEPIEAQRRSRLILSILAGVSGVLGMSALALRRQRNPPPLAEVAVSGPATEGLR